MTRGVGCVEWYVWEDWMFFGWSHPLPYPVVDLKSVYAGTKGNEWWIDDFIQ